MNAEWMSYVKWGIVIFGAIFALALFLSKKGQ